MISIQETGGTNMPSQLSLKPGEEEIKKKRAGGNSGSESGWLILIQTRQS